MISKIKLKNWKSHLDSEFEFSEGVNAMIGINGAGKSSVLDAISFALFGTFPNHANRKVSLDDLIMGKPMEKEEAEISLEFFLGAKKYSVLRRVKKGKGTVHAEIREDGRLIEVNPNSVTGHVEKILQINYPLFSKAVYSEQNNIDYFLTIPKGRRMQHIDRMLDLDRFEFVRESAGSIKNIVQTRLAEKTRLLTELKKEGVESKIEASLKTMQGLEADKKTVTDSVNSVKAEIDEINNRLSEIEVKEGKFSEAEKRLVETRAAYKEVSSALQEKLFLVGNSTKESLITDVENHNRKIEGNEKAIREGKELMEACRNKVAAYNVEIKTTLESLLDLEKIKGSRCPVCENEISDLKKTALKSNREKRIEELKKMLGSPIKEIGSLRDSLESLEKENKAAAKELEKMGYRIGEFETIERLKNKARLLETEIERFDAEKNLLAEELQRLDLKKLRDLLSEKTRGLGGLQSRVSSTDYLLKKEKALLDDLLKRQGIILDCQKAAETSGKIVSLLDNFMQAIKATQEQLRGEFTKTVNNVMDKVWGDLYPYSDLESVRLSISEGDYVLEAKNMDSWRPVDGLASGGERSLACLALRVAFSLAFVPNLKWLILDEPTNNLDSNSIQKFSSALSGDIGKFVNQIFLITHESRLAEDVEGSVYKLERDKAANGATKVVKI